MSHESGDRAEIICSGRVWRLDLVPSEGYAGWIFRSQDSRGWDAELRMPLIQEALAEVLDVPSRSVRVGVYAFGDRRSESRVYTSPEIRSARRRFAKLLANLGF